MDGLPLVVSFYTRDTPYEDEARRLKGSCDLFSIESEIDSIESSGSWEMNCAFKPLFLLKKLEEKKRPLLWVDADAIFLEKLPKLEVFSSPFAVRLYNCPDTHPSRVVSSVVYVTAERESIEILKQWAQTCISLLKEESRREVWDQDALRSVLFSKEFKGIWEVFPEEFSVIEDHPDDAFAKDPILKQTQASRRYKQWINHPEKRFFTG